jgi:hypothetical protein
MERTISLLLVGAQTPTLERKRQLLGDAGFAVTLADNICEAEVYSEAQYFDGAVYDESLSETEQVSLARVMRVRWPWMRLVRCGHLPLSITEDAVFDATSASEARLSEVVRDCLSA